MKNKYLLCIAACLWPLLAFSQHLYVNLVDSGLGLEAATNRTVLITGNSLPRGVSGGVVVQDKFRKTTDVEGGFWLSNLVAGVYFVDVIKPSFATYPAERTTFYVLHTNTTGITYARDAIVANPGNTYPPDSVAWGALASDRRYVKQNEITNLVSILGSGGNPNALSNNHSAPVEFENTVTASTFIGNLEGIADTALTANIANTVSSSVVESYTLAAEAAASNATNGLASSAFGNASGLNVGTLNAARLPSTINADTTGNAATATVSAKATANANGQSLAAVTTNIFNVLDYGADPTGANWCGTNIQNAINAAAVAGGGIVYFPKGRYNYGVSLPWGPTKFLSEGYPCMITIWSNNITLLGEGKFASVVFLPNQALGVPLRNFIGSPEDVDGGDDNYSITNFVMQGLGLDLGTNGLADNLYDTTQFYNVYGSGITFRDVSIINNKDADAIDCQNFRGATHISNLTIDDVYIENVGGDAIGVQNSHILINNVYMNNVGEQALELFGLTASVNNVVAKNLDGALALAVVRSDFNNCHFETTNATSKTLADGYGGLWSTRFVGCKFIDTGTGSNPQQVLTGNTLRNLEFVGCTFESSSRPFLRAESGAGIRVQASTVGTALLPLTGPTQMFVVTGGSDITFADNTCYGAAQFFVVTNGVDRVSIRGNILRGGSIRVAAVTNMVLANNVFTSSAELRATNTYYSVFDANKGAALYLYTSTSNVMVGNDWASISTDSYTSQSLRGESVGFGNSTNVGVFTGLHYGTNSGYFFGDGGGLTNLVPPIYNENFITGPYYIDSSATYFKPIGQEGNLFMYSGSSDSARQRAVSGKQGCYGFITAATAGALAGFSADRDTTAGGHAVDLGSAGLMWGASFKLDTINNVVLKIGMLVYSTPGAVTTNEVNGSYIRYDSRQESVFKVVNRQTTETATTTGITADTGWHTVWARRTASGFDYYVDGGAAISVNTTVPGGGTPSLSIGAVDAVSKEVKIDWFRVYAQ